MMWIMAQVKAGPTVPGMFKVYSSRSTHFDVAYVRAPAVS